jgi:DNA-binding transcriptional LysR family regulator
MFDELQQGMRDIAFLKDPGVGEVRIGCPESLSAGFVPAIIDRLSRKYPDVVVHVHQTQTAEQEFRELRERAVDLMLGRLLKPLADDDVDMEILCDDHFVVAVGAKNPLADRKRLALAELMDEPWILFPATNVTGAYVAGMFRARGLSPPRKIVSSFSMQLRMHLLATGRYVTVLQNSVLHYNAKRWSLTSLALDLPIEPAPIALFALKNRTLSPVVTRFIEQARTVARSMQPGGGRHRR